MNPHLLNGPLSHRHRIAAIFSTLVAGLLLAGCTPPEPIDEGIKAPISVPLNSFQISWATKMETKHGQITRLFSRDTVIVGYTDDGTSYVLDRPTGNFLHTETVRNGSQTLHPPVVLKDYIVYPTNTALEIYDRAGALVRSKNLGYSIRSDAIGHRSYVYLGADFVGGARIVAIDINSEYLDHRWSLMFPNSGITSAPVLFGDIVYAAAENGEVAAVAFDTREPVWPLTNGVFKTYGPVIADLVADEAGVYVASTDTKLCALNRNNGKVKWQYLAATDLTEAPVATRDMVYQHVPKLGWAAIDKISGPYNRTPKWVGTDIVRILAQDEKYVYVLRDDKAVAALDKTNGKAVFTSTRHDLVTFTTNIKDGTIYAVTNANRVMAIASVLKPGVVGEIAWEPVITENRVALAR